MAAYCWDLVAGDHPELGQMPLIRNDGRGGFEDVSQEAGVDRVRLPMGANYGDIDNDGWLDFYLGTGEPDLAALFTERNFS